MIISFWNLYLRLQYAIKKYTVTVISGIWAAAHCFLVYQAVCFCNFLIGLHITRTMFVYSMDFSFFMKTRMGWSKTLFIGKMGTRLLWMLRFVSCLWRFIILWFLYVSECFGGKVGLTGSTSISQILEIASIRKYWNIFIVPSMHQFCDIYEV